MQTPIFDNVPVNSPKTMSCDQISLHCVSTSMDSITYKVANAETNYNLEDYDKNEQGQKNDTLEVLQNARVKLLTYVGKDSEQCNLDLANKLAMMDDKGVADICKLLPEKEIINKPDIADSGCVSEHYCAIEKHFSSNYSTNYLNNSSELTCPLGKHVGSKIQNDYLYNPDQCFLTPRDLHGWTPELGAKKNFESTTCGGNSLVASNLSSKGQYKNCSLIDSVVTSVTDATKIEENIILHKDASDANKVILGIETQI